MGISKPVHLAHGHAGDTIRLSRFDPVGDFATGMHRDRKYKAVFWYKAGDESQWHQHSCKVTAASPQAALKVLAVYAKSLTKMEDEAIRQAFKKRKITAVAVNIRGDIGTTSLMPAELAITLTAKENMWIGSVARSVDPNAHLSAPQFIYKQVEKTAENYRDLQERLHSLRQRRADLQAQLQRLQGTDRSGMSEADRASLERQTKTVEEKLSRIRNFSKWEHIRRVTETDIDHVNDISREVEHLYNELDAYRGILTDEQLLAQVEAFDEELQANHEEINAAAERFYIAQQQLGNEADATTRSETLQPLQQELSQARARRQEILDREREQVYQAMRRVGTTRPTWITRRVLSNQVGAQPIWQTVRESIPAQPVHKTLVELYQRREELQSHLLELQKQYNKMEPDADKHYEVKPEKSMWQKMTGIFSKADGSHGQYDHVFHRRAAERR